MSLPATMPTLVMAIQRLLLERGPQTEDQLIEGLRELGLHLGDDPEDTVADVLASDHNVLAMPLIDERWALLSTLLDGRIFTHRLQPAEVEHDLVATFPDLEPLIVLLDDNRYSHLVDGSPIVEVDVNDDGVERSARGIPIDVVPPTGALLLPAGTLATLAAQAGDLIGLRVTRDGLSIERIPTADVQAVPDSVGDLLTSIVSRHPGMPVPDTVAAWTACAEQDQLLRRPLPPWGEITGLVGLSREASLLAPADFDFSRWRFEMLVDEIEERYDLDEDQAMAVLALCTAHDRVLDVVELGDVADEFAEDTVLYDDVLPFLADAAVAEAVLAETVNIAPAAAAALGALVDTFQEQAPPEAQAALSWLQAKALERMGRTADAEDLLKASLKFDPDWSPALRDMATFESDRGHAADAVALLRRARVPNDDDFFRALQRLASIPVRDLGRNKSCWCGSGRKYKMCHLGREKLPLHQRAGWLYMKAAMYLYPNRWDMEFLEVAEARARYWTDSDALATALSDPLVIDAMLFEGGVFRAFLSERGELLPDDERLLAHQWLLVDRSIYEIEVVRPGIGLTMRDLRTGDRYEVDENLGSRNVQRGMLVCGRVVPVGDDTDKIFGGMEIVRLHQRDELLELLDSGPEPLELVDYLTSRFAPPTLSNTEGDPWVFCEATLRTSDAASLAARLDATFCRLDVGANNRDGGYDARWHQYVTTGGMQRVRATLSLTGDELKVEVNSERRLEHVLEVLRRLDPDITVLSQSRDTVRDVLEAQSRSSSWQPESPLNPPSPEVAAALEEFVRAHEQSWLDESIPALAGCTPRQAAADPTRRGDLIRLLDSLPPATAPGMMSAERIRAALDLPHR